jgi:hypothetical protein
LNKARRCNNRVFTVTKTNAAGIAVSMKDDLSNHPSHGMSSQLDFLNNLKKMRADFENLELKATTCKGEIGGFSFLR